LRARQASRAQPADAELLAMAQWKKTPRQPPKTKAELREMLTEAARNAIRTKAPAEGQERS